MADFVFSTTPLIRLANCVLRPYHASDLLPMCAAANDPQIVSFMRDAFPHPYNEEAGLAWLRICRVDGLPPVEGQHQEEAQAQPPKNGSSLAPPPADLNLAICLLDGTFVGGTGLRPISADGTDRYSREIGYWIARAHWGRGLATEVAAGLGRWALSPASCQITTDGKPLLRIEACVYSNNVASTVVLGRAGYVREGVRRQAVIKNGVVQDVIIYGLVLSDLEVVQV